MSHRNMLQPKIPRPTHTNRRPIKFLVSGMMLSLLFAPAPIAGDEAMDVVRIEEDWEVVLNEPDEDVDAPQFHTLIAPFAQFEPFHFQISWNYRGEPEFDAGGMQVLAWFGESCIGQKSYRDDKLSCYAETITWTSVLETTGCSLKFEVINGVSQTWGSFGGPETNLTGPIIIPNLNFYSPDFSVSNSWISYGSNRVDILRIKEVRYIDREGRILRRDTNSRVVFELDDGAIILDEDEVEGE